MSVPSLRQLCALCLLWCFGCWSVRDVQNEDLNDILWRDQNEVRIDYKYLHVHPLLRLSPKLSQRRKKKVVLLVREHLGY
uniref:Uncharacterized protein n=1 Tax=Periophthalmus magnuspinnatus TaxID=409849 RepID=A0A3B3ZNG2_9GOBI